MPCSHSSCTAGCSNTATGSSDLTQLYLVLDSSSLRSIEDSSACCTSSHTCSSCAPSSGAQELVRSPTASTRSGYDTARPPSIESIHSSIHSPTAPGSSPAYGSAVSYATDRAARLLFSEASDVNVSIYETAHGSSPSFDPETTCGIPEQDHFQDAIDTSKGAEDNQTPAVFTLSPAPDAAPIPASQVVEIASPAAECIAQEVAPGSLSASPSQAGSYPWSMIDEYLEYSEAAPSARYTPDESDSDNYLPVSESSVSSASSGPSGHIALSSLSLSPAGRLTPESLSGSPSLMPPSLDRSVIPPPAESSLPSISSVSSIDITTTDERAVTRLSSAESWLPLLPRPSAVDYAPWGLETDGSYESSVLAASASSHSLPIPDGSDASFVTSLLDPTHSSSLPTVSNYAGEGRVLSANQSDVDTRSGRATLGTSAPSPLTPATPASSAAPSFATISPPSAMSSPPVSLPTSPSTPALSGVLEATPPQSTFTGTLSTPTTASSGGISSSLASTNGRRAMHSPLSSADMSTVPSLLPTHASSVDEAPVRRIQRLPYQSLTALQ